MESKLNPVKPTFSILKARLIRVINRRLYSGEFTERGLARILQVSQTHLHHVLKQRRKLRAELADGLMAKLSINILDLLDNAELSDECRRRAGQLVSPTQGKSRGNGNPF